MWLDLGMQIDGREDEAHITIFDHPKNDGFPSAWRVDDQFGVGPSRARQGDWTIPAGKDKTFRHRLVIHTGELNDKDITEQWRPGAGRQYTYALWGIAQEEGPQGQVSHPTGSGRGDDAAGRLRGQRLRPRADDHATDGVLLGRSRAHVDRGEPRLRIAWQRLFQLRRQPHPDPRRHRPRRRGRLAQGLPRRHPLPRRDRGRHGRPMAGRAAEPAVCPRPRRQTTRPTWTTSRCA